MKKPKAWKPSPQQWAIVAAIAGGKRLPSGAVRERGGFSPSLNALHRNGWVVTGGTPTVKTNHGLRLTQKAIDAMPEKWRAMFAANVLPGAAEGNADDQA